VVDVEQLIGMLSGFRGRNYVKPEEIYNLTKVPVAALGRESFPYRELSDREVAIVSSVFDRGLELLRKVLPPSVVRDIEVQKPYALVFAGVAKALMDGKNYAFPSVGGHLGVNWLFPQNVPTNYKNNSWDIDITTGTKAYIFGSDTAFYTTSSTVNTRHCILVFHNGLIELGTTPSTQQFRLYSVAKGDYGIYTVAPLIDVPVDPSRVLFQYPTPLGALFLDYQLGVRWYFLPTRSGTTTMKLLGLVFYEHDFASDVKYLA
jgi:hypothetical protein